MTDTVPPDAVVIGLGLMGSALTTKLLQHGFKVSVWNRSPAKLKPMEDLGAKSYSTLNEALSCADSLKTIIFVFLQTYDQTQSLLFSDDSTSKVLKEKYLCCLCSGNPDESRDFSKKVSSLNLAMYIDGTVIGNPATIAAGKGIFLLSYDDYPVSFLKEQKSHFWELFETVAKTVVTGKMGSGKAVDYAVVDFYLMNVIIFCNGLAMCDSEGVDLEIYLDLIDCRLPVIPMQLRNLMNKMTDKTYDSNINVSLDTIETFFKSRVPYLQKHNINTDMTQFAIQLIEKTINLDPQCSKNSDFTKVQEIIRFGREGSL